MSDCFCCVLVLGKALTETNLTNKIEVKLTRNEVLGKICIITCETSSLTNAVSFQHPPGIFVGSCPLPGKTCIHGVYNLTQKLTERKTILTIPSYSKQRDDGVWLCNYRGISSNLLNLNASSKWFSPRLNKALRNLFDSN